MSKRTDLSGRRVGKLIVTTPAPSRKGNTYWHCQCDCGRLCSQPKSALISNPPKVQSCGCNQEDYLNKGVWGRIAWKRHTLVRPIAYFPKSKQQRLFPKTSRPFWICLCRCGRFLRASTTDLRRGKVISCSKPACIARAEQILAREVENEYLHNTRRKHLTRVSYDAMLGRCQHAKAYEHINVCRQWKGPDGFEQFIRDISLRPHGGMSLERRDPAQGYSPANCKWADDHTQRRNKRNSVRYIVGSEVMNLADLARAVGSTSRKTRQKIDRMVANGFTPDQAAERIMGDWSSAAQCAV